jgi:hypothetical protein
MGLLNAEKAAEKARTAKRVSWGRKRVPEGKCNSQKMQLAGTKDGGWVYTEWDLEVQNGESG